MTKNFVKIYALLIFFAQLLFKTVSAQFYTTKIYLDKNSSVYSFSINNQPSGYIFEFKQENFYLQLHSEFNSYNFLELHNQLLRENCLKFVFSGLINDYDKPFGIYAENGKLINENILTTGLDGLGIIQNGEFQVFNIRKNFYFENKKINLNTSSDKKIFFDIIEKENLTVFQVQLLYFRNTILMTSQLNEEPKERRFFALIEKNNQVFYQIIYCFNEEGLYNLLKNYVNFLQTNNCQIKWILNMDTGIFNYQKFFSETHQEVPNFSVGYFSQLDDQKTLFYLFSKK